MWSFGPGRFEALPGWLTILQLTCCVCLSKSSTSERLVDSGLVGSTEHLPRVMHHPVYQYTENGPDSMSPNRLGPSWDLHQGPIALSLSDNPPGCKSGICERCEFFTSAGKVVWVSRRDHRRTLLATNISRQLSCGDSVG